MDYRNRYQAPAARRPRHHRRWLIVALPLVVIAIAAALYLRSKPASAPLVAKQSSQASPKTTANGHIKLIATGDILPHDAINQAAQRSSMYNYSQFFAHVRQFTTAGDIRYCNQESPSASSFSVSGYPTFNAPQAFPNDLSGVGCNLINLANNHADDKGQSGIDQTIDSWKDLHPLAVVGTAKSAADQQTVHYFTVKGLRFAYLGYAECSNNKTVSNYGLNLLSNTALLTAQLHEARQNADFVIGGVHSCSEGTRTPDAAINQAVQTMANSGVDLVIGTGPHWLQSVTRLPRSGGGDTVVWYSLGNFLSAQTDIGGLIGGVAVTNIDVKTHKITSIGFLPTYMHYSWTAQQKAQNDLLARHDFMLYPLDQAAAPLKDSQDNTTVEAQTKLVTDLVNQYTPVKMLTSKSFTSFN